MHPLPLTNEPPLEIEEMDHTVSADHQNARESVISEWLWLHLELAAGELLWTLLWPNGREFR